MHFLGWKKGADIPAYFQKDSWGTTNNSESTNTTQQNIIDFLTSIRRSISIQGDTLNMDSVYSDNEEEELGKAVLNAHKMENPLNLLEPSVKSIVLKNGKTGIIEHYKIRQLSTSLMKWVMDLMTRNMKRMYKKSTGGWKPKAKRREMTEEASRYLIAFVENKPVAFSHFQFDMDYGRQVLYCYEIQVEPDARSCGLGKRIMESLEKIAEHAGLPLVVLTVFKFNSPSLDFFKRMGYTTDETCPGEEEKKDYVILSKKNPAAEVKVMEIGSTLWYRDDVRICYSDLPYVNQILPMSLQTR